MCDNNYRNILTIIFFSLDDFFWSVVFDCNAGNDRQVGGRGLCQRRVPLGQQEVPVVVDPGA